MDSLEDDLAAVFYGPDVATPFRRHRPAVEPAPVWAIVGVVDAEEFEGRVLAAQRTAQMPASADVRVGDELEALAAVDASMPIGTRFKVLEGARVVDGREFRALLGGVPQ
ncbi:MAG: hypothetical protein J0H69_19530 [Burkholderiales bacterium]|nr:hypothetical protein [Burkholderiales bacterium]